MLPLLAALLLAGPALALHPPPPIPPFAGAPQAGRKSLSFGPTHPSARLIVPQRPIVAADFGSSRSSHNLHASASKPEWDDDPKAVAEQLVKHLHPETEYVVREDSYTDATTGVSHVYLRQLINGLEVVDGDINVNVMDGGVLSYGDSFYRGPTPAPMTDPSLLEESEDQSAYCSLLATSFASLTSTSPSNQQPFTPHSADAQEASATLLMLAAHNCPHLSMTFTGAESHSEGIVDPSVAALNFMILAHPEPEIALSMQADYPSHLASITPIPVAHLSTSGPTLALHDVPHTLEPVIAKLAYAQTPAAPSDPTSAQPLGTTLNLVWHLTVMLEDNAYEAFMSATRPQRLVASLDWVSDATVPIPRPGTPKAEASYNVWPWGINDPTDGNRSMLKGYDTTASPIGWHAIPASLSPLSQVTTSALASAKPDPDDDPVLNFTTTWGNNVFAHENLAGRNDWEDNFRPDAGSSMSFDYEWLPKENDTMVTPTTYMNLSVTQLFYTSNMVHDLFYRYGFDEVSGNFQQYNFGKGGKEGDAVIANAQDGSGYNNANFMTPPDGTNGRMRMYVWNTARPWRDGDLEAGIVIHELSHGLSTRLTGGPANSGCLAWGESGGMGEGWGDFLATTIRSTSTYADYAMGSWAANRPTGIRNYMYSLNMTVNPSTYKTLDKPGYWGVHAIGEVWAQALWIVSNRLIKVHGFSDSLFPPEALANGTVPVGDFYREAKYDGKGQRLPLIPKNGNSLAVQLVLNGMKLQPCRPSFFDARDAILQADAVLTGGENQCEIWKGFSERGLGPNATLRGGTPWGGGIRTDDYTLPAGLCEAEE